MLLTPFLGGNVCDHVCCNTHTHTLLYIRQYSPVFWYHRSYMHMCMCDAMSRTCGRWYGKERPRVIKNTGSSFSLLLSPFLCGEKMIQTGAGEGKNVREIVGISWYLRISHWIYERQTVDLMMSFGANDMIKMVQIRIYWDAEMILSITTKSHREFFSLFIDMQWQYDLS